MEFVEVDEDELFLLGVFVDFVFERRYFFFWFFGFGGCLVVWYEGFESGIFLEELGGMLVLFLEVVDEVGLFVV